MEYRSIQTPVPQTVPLPGAYHRIELKSATGAQHNPSIFVHEDKLQVVVRVLVSNQRYIWEDLRKGFSKVKTINYIADVLDSWDLTSARAVGHQETERLERQLEDLRVFSWRGGLWAIAATHSGHDPPGEIRQALIEFDEAAVSMQSVRALLGHARHEKNWMPCAQGDTLQFVYSIDPLVVVSTQSAVLPPVQAGTAYVRGGSQLVPWRDGWLAVVHQVHQPLRPDPVPRNPLMSDFWPPVMTDPVVGLTLCPQGRGGSSPPGGTPLFILPLTSHAKRVDARCSKLYILRKLTLTLVAQWKSAGLRNRRSAVRIGPMGPKNAADHLEGWLWRTTSRRLRGWSRRRFRTWSRPRASSSSMWTAGRCSRSTSPRSPRKRTLCSGRTRSTTAVAVRTSFVASASSSPSTRAAGFVRSGIGPPMRRRSPTAGWRLTCATSCALRASMICSVWVRRRRASARFIRALSTRRQAGPSHGSTFTPGKSRATFGSASPDQARGDYRTTVQVFARGLVELTAERGGDRALAHRGQQPLSRRRAQVGALCSFRRRSARSCPRARGANVTSSRGRTRAARRRGFATP